MFKAGTKGKIICGLGTSHLTPNLVNSLNTLKSKHKNTTELNYIVSMFEFNAESMGQVNYYVPTHNVS
jgi:hypothetical protein